MALKTFEGTVTKIFTRQVNGRDGNQITAYSAKVGNHEEWVSMGFKQPPFEEGDDVTIVAKEEKGFWKPVDVTVTSSQTSSAETAGATKASGASGSAVSAATSAPAASSSTNSSKTWKPKDPAETKAIHYQNSRSAAIALADLLLKHNALPMSSTTGKAGTAKRFEEIQAVVNKLTVTLFHDLETYRLLNDIEDVYEKPSAAEAGFDGPPEEAEDD